MFAQCNNLDHVQIPEIFNFQTLLENTKKNLHAPFITGKFRLVKFMSRPVIRRGDSTSLLGTQNWMTILYRNIWIKYSIKYLNSQKFVFVWRKNIGHFILASYSTDKLFRYYGINIRTQDLVQTSRFISWYIILELRNL